MPPTPRSAKGCSGPPQPWRFWQFARLALHAGRSGPAEATRAVERASSGGVGTSRRCAAAVRCILGMQINQPRKSEFIKIASEDDVASKGARYACGIGVEVGLAIAARQKMCQDDLLDLVLGGNFADLLDRK